MVRIFCDAASIADMLAVRDLVDGYTTNPTLMRKAGVTNYITFGLEAAALGKPVSLEVFADDFTEMERQAKLIASWGENVYVKIPITNTKGESSIDLIKSLSAQGIKVNVTAVFTFEQIDDVARISVLRSTPAILSIFAGRIADTGLDPGPYFVGARLRCAKNVKVLWASTRELYNIREATICGADIITISPDLIKKFDLRGKDLKQYSLETVRQFHEDAKASGFSL